MKSKFKPGDIVSTSKMFPQPNKVIRNSEDMPDIKVPEPGKPYKVLSSEIIKIPIFGEAETLVLEGLENEHVPAKFMMTNQRKWGFNADSFHFYQVGKELPPMPEHTASADCPACAEMRRVMDEMNQTEVIKRFKALAEYIAQEHENIAKEFGVRVSTVYMGGLQNEQTDRIGEYAKTIVVEGPKGTVKELLQELTQRIIMPDLAGVLEKIFEDNDKHKSVPSHIFMGKPGQA